MQVASGMTVTFQMPMQSNWINKFITDTGRSKIYTIEVISGEATAPTNAKIWMDAEFLATPGSPISTFSTTRTTNILTVGTTLTASTQAWDTGATARANSTSYSLRDTFKVASNAGRLFICTTAGTSAGSEPGGYATAVDGGTVTDGGAVFTAMWRQKIAITATQQVRGMMRARICAVLPALSSVWFDPKITVA
jgi:hypothetical protein